MNRLMARMPAFRGRYGFTWSLGLRRAAMTVCPQDLPGVRAPRGPARPGDAAEEHP